MKQVMPKKKKQKKKQIPFTQNLRYFFLINSLKSISTFKTIKKIFNETLNI